MELRSFSHCKGESNFHIVFCPKYRRPIFRHKRIKHVCMKEFMKSAEKHRMTIRVIRIMDDHNHVFISLTSWQNPSFAVHKLKGCSAKKLFDTFPWLKKYFKRGFWSRGYFFRSVGSTTDEAVEFYIRISQDKKLRSKYYTHVRKKKTKFAKTSEDPYIEYLKGKLKVAQTRLDSFITRSPHF